MGTICTKEPETKTSKKRIIQSSNINQNIPLSSERGIESMRDTPNTASHKSMLSKQNIRFITPDKKLVQTAATSISPSIQQSKKFNSQKKKPIINIDPVTGQESSILKILKKHNRDFEDKELIEECLMKHFFMRSLEKQARNEIVKEMSLCFVPEGSTIFKQGMIGTYFYILQKGKVELLINDKSVKTLSTGENFGELALLHGAPRSGTIKAVTDCYLWVLERKNFKKIVDHITQSQFNENKKFIQSTPILSCLDINEKNILCSNLYKVSFEPGEYIVKEGEQADCLYIIKEGEVECSKKGKVIRILKQGDNFGERGILIDSNRTLDVISKTQSICYSVSIATFKLMLGDNFREMLYLNFIKTAFANSKLFKKLNTKLFEGKVFKLFSPVNLSNSVAFEKGYDPSSKIVVIVDGNLVLESKKNEILAKRGSILFEDELLNDKHDLIEENICASPDCLFVQANKQEVLDIFGNTFSELISMGNIIHCLKNVILFKTISHKKLSQISLKVKIQKFKKGDKIISQGEEGTKFYIVKSGKIDIFIGDNKYVRTIGKNDYLGERALLISEPRSATAIAAGEVEVFYLEKEAFLLSIEENMKQHLINRLFLQDSSVELKDLNYVMPLGSGNYGKVSLVQSVKNEFLYAIKSISRKKINDEQLYPNLQLEKDILLQIDHPFIVKLVKTLKDSHNVYFLMEYVKGKELFDVIRDIGLLNKRQTQFFSASMMLATDYLHENKFIFRDIKPENIMVCDNGFLKLIDFGTAKQIKERTSTVIGTPHYMAPEIILGEGYSFQVDFWSIAICMYEFMCGFVPFGENAEEPMEVYLAIINEQLNFPEYCKDKKFRSLISQMLCKNPISRISKLGQIKIHPWFCEFDWEGLMSLNIRPEVIPKLKVNELDMKKNEKEKYCNIVKTMMHSVEFLTDNVKKNDSNDKNDEFFKNF